MKSVPTRWFTTEEEVKNMIKNIKRIDGIPTPDALRELTSESIEEGKEKFLHDLFLIHKDHIGKYMVKEAKKGHYECWSDKLENITEWDCEIPTAEISEYLQKKIYTVFGGALGFDVAYIPADNVMVISWEK